MSRLEPLRPEQLDARQRALYAAIVNGPRKGSGLVDDQGALRGPFDPLLRTPAIGDAVQHLGAVIRFEGELPDRLRELTIILVAAHWGCSFELSAHGPLAEAAGVEPAVVAAIRAGQRPTFEPGSVDSLIAQAIGELLADRRLTEPTFDTLLTVLGEAQTSELVVVVGYYSLLAMVLEGFGISG